jgi:putative sterol carrier protein
MSVDDVSPTAMDPREFARMVKRTAPADLAQLVGGERRGPLLDALVTAMPGVFRADVAGDTNAVVHWNITGRPDGGTDVYELVIGNRTCTLSPAPGRTPDLTLTLDAVDFLLLVTGNAHPVMLVMRGKLRTKGDLRLTARFPNMFDNPKP